jgi:RNA polymerase sigma-70 factor (ECF subfamily)
MSAAAPVGQRFFDLGSAAWPEFVLPLTAFESYFARHALAETPPEEAYAADMYLACACANGDPKALAALDRTLKTDVARAVGSIDRSRELLEEALQGTRERLLVREGDGPARIADYAGRASLRNWLCVVATRWVLTQRRRKSERPHAPFRDQDDERLASGGPEFDYLRRRYKLEFEEGLRRAIQELPPKPRLLLRLHVVDGVGIDKIAVIFHVGRSTAARWIAAARASLYDRVRRNLRAKLHLTSSELESLAADIQSQLDASIIKLLARSRDVHDAP